MKSSEMRRAAVYTFIVDYQHAHGYGPSLREISQETGIASVSLIHSYIERLVADGLLLKTPGIARSYRPT